MTHPLVDQLRFARSEFVRCLDGVSDEDARKRLLPMNSISWMIGHLANQEDAYWGFLARGKRVHPELYDLVGFGKPASTPPLDEMWTAWREVTAAADAYLDILTAETLLTHFSWQGEPMKESVGTLLLRNIYHYWFHTGEAHAVRQMLGHPDLPQFVGDFGDAIFRPEVAMT
ncbi:MAG: DinB family protein [Caldilineae bacterium]|nr:DinB family protein [Anaerolineae bacterium]MCB9152712.1 DinB family protein [Caldilineae bacterium]